MNRLGNWETLLEENIEEGISRRIVEESDPYHLNYKRQAAHLEQLTKYLKNEEEFQQPGDAFPTCHSNRSGPPDPTAMFMFGPAWTGQLKAGTSL